MVASTHARADRISPTMFCVPDDGDVWMQGHVDCEEGYWDFRGAWGVWPHTTLRKFKWRSKLKSMSTCPPTGQYSGQFFMKEAHGDGDTIYEERDLFLAFASGVDGAFHINGSGRNDFIVFSVVGVLNCTKEFQVVKKARV